MNATTGLVLVTDLWTSRLHNVLVFLRPYAAPWWPNHALHIEKSGSWSFDVSEARHGCELCLVIASAVKLPRFYWHDYSSLELSSAVATI